MPREKYRERTTHTNTEPKAELKQFVLHQAFFCSLVGWSSKTDTKSVGYWNVESLRSWWLFSLNIAWYSPLLACTYACLYPFQFPMCFYARVHVFVWVHVFPWVFVCVCVFVRVCKGVILSVFLCVNKSVCVWVIVPVWLSVCMCGWVSVCVAGCLSVSSIVPIPMDTRGAW